MTSRAAYHTLAEGHLRASAGLGPADPVRIDHHRLATVYALLALGQAPAPQIAFTREPDAEVSTPPPPSDTPPAQTPRKRTAKKTTARKETTK
jgi:hypothetical protein